MPSVSSAVLGRVPVRQRNEVVGTNLRADAAPLISRAGPSRHHVPELHPVTRELATGKNFAAVTTMLPSGQFQTGVMWVGVRDGSVVLNTETHRRRYKNLIVLPNPCMRAYG